MVSAIHSPLSCVGSKAIVAQLQRVRPHPKDTRRLIGEQRRFTKASGQCRAWQRCLHPARAFVSHDPGTPVARTKEKRQSRMRFTRRAQHKRGFSSSRSAQLPQHPLVHRWISRMFYPHRHSPLTVGGSHLPIIRSLVCSNLIGSYLAGFESRLRLPAHTILIAV